ncbi:Hypothetical protein FKW44_005792, partial [Caligus rogercresseyi]
AYNGSYTLYLRVIGSVLLTLALAEGLRGFASRLLRDGIIKTAILEFLAAAELCG